MTEITSQLSAALADRYRIERRLGEGGMATVYLAEDLKHHRKVALKVLKPELAAVIGGERFIHEIKVTANLQHPNILALYDSGEAGAILYYVMPYVEGESLRERLDRERQLPVEQAVEIAKSVANALDYAHRNGVVHRDIKPENILLHEGQPLVADFGIALAVSAAAGNRLTETGLSLGTPNYMSPEQATAERELDARSDVYSLGVLLYEMLVGQVPFLAPSVQAIVAMILTEEPIPIAARRPSVPLHVEGVVAKAMQKLAADRFSSAQEFGRALSDVTFVGPRTVARAPAGPAEAGRRARSTLVAWVIAATTTVVALVATMAWLGSGSPPARVQRQRIVLGRVGLGERSVRYSAALAPDGSGIAYVDSVGGSTALLFKPRDAIEAIALAGTGDAQAPFFSPDGRWIGFFSDGVLKKVSRAGGGAATVTSGANPVAATGAWSEDGHIYFVGAGYDIRRVSEEGGESEEVVSPGTMPRIGRALSLLWALPGGRGVLFSGCTSECAEAEVYAYDAATDTVAMLFENAHGAWYVPGGYVLYTSPEGGAFAAPFDLATLRATGGGIPVLEGVSSGDLTLGPDGTLLYSRGAVTTSTEELVWVTRDGSASLVDATWVRSFGHPALSPDGRTLAIGVHEASGETNLWLKPLDGGPASKLTFGRSDVRPAWAPDGGSIAFARGVVAPGLYEVTVGGTDTVRPLLKASDSVPRINEAAYSPDGEWLIYRQIVRQIVGGRSTLFALNLESDSTIPLVVEDYNAYAPAVAPDGRWLAFESDRTGRWEVYVRPFPNASDGEWTVSASGGYAPRWARSGDEIFYLDGDGTMWSVGVVRAVPFRTTTRRRLFDASVYKLDLHQQYDVAPDGRFLMVRDRDVRQGAERELVWVENWPEELRAKMKR
jgi:Tol biopolymer transport system component/tRNA A-37 threonylcarbamoyl transferase component Bud32